MAATAPANGLLYEFDSTPETGATMPVADGVHWLRMPLPFALAHINLWLLEDGDEWVIVDTGLHTDDSTSIWQHTLNGTMGGRRVNRVIATHLHPDHAGNAGWLSERCNAVLHMTRSEYLMGRVLIADTGRPAPEPGIRFYHAAGFPDDATERYQKMFGMFGRVMSAMPESYRRLQDGDVLTIGGREWEVVVGNGHSPEHACLYCRELNVLLSGDQILPTISSNVSVYPTEPEANPLQDWLRSIDKLLAHLPEDVLVLPAHGRPFRGVHGRLCELRDDHLRDLEQAARLCAEPKRAVDVFPALFRREIKSNELIMATGEAIAHLNWLINDGQVTRETDSDGVHWYQRCR
jgi:glyoxylase-like metal-dependent hydrolase (beta-lactamase superfamily II)